MAKTPLPIANGFYLSDSLPISAQECTNWYPNIVQTAGLSQDTLFGTPGKRELTAGIGIRQANRGADTLNEIAYFVNGNTLYRLVRTVAAEIESFTTTALGTIEGQGRVSIAANNTQLCVLVPGGKGYIFTADPDTLTEITDLDFRANGEPQTVVYIDGYFLFTTDTKKFIVSSLNDGLAYNALDFGTAEADPDDIISAMVFANQLFIGGSETLEAFQNIGGSDFPFQRTGLFIEKGFAGKFAAINASNTFMFIGQGRNESPAIWSLAGNTVEKVSTTAIDNLLQELSSDEISEVFAWSYAEKGAYFVGFALPTTCIVYDTITQRWHERKSQVTDYIGNSPIVRSRINSVVKAYGRILVGDSQDGRIGELSTDVYSEYGNDIIRRFVTQPFQNNMESFLVPSIELTMEAGVGNDAVPYPQIRMDRSVDGKTWTDARSRPIGKKGEYNRRAIWRRNGRAARFESFGFEMSDAIKPVAIQLTADIVIG